MRLLSSVLIVMALAVLPQVTTLAAPPKVQLPLTAVDAGVFTFTGQTSALINGDGFEKQGFGGLNIKVRSTGQFDLLGPATKCADGFTGLLVGSLVQTGYIGNRINREHG